MAMSTNLNAVWTARLGAAALAMFASLCWQGPALAQTNKIAAIVNGTPITSTEVNERMGLVRITQHKNLTNRQALDMLVDEVLVQQEAKRRTMTIPDSEVDERFASVAANTKMSLDQLGQALAQAGTSSRAFKANIRTQLLQRKIVGALLRTAQGSLNEKDIAAQMTQMRQEGKGTSYRFVLQQIVFVMPKGSPPAKIAQRKQEAESWRRNITGCEDGAKRAIGMRDVAVKSQVVKMSAQLSAGLREQLDITPVGKATAPLPNELGVEVVLVCDKREAQDDTILRQQVQGELAGDLGKGELDKFVADLRKRALVQYR